jgi:hypothetical protein
MEMSGIRSIGDTFLRHSPILLSCLGAAGVIATSVLAVRATPKAIELIKADSWKKHDGDPNASTTVEMIEACWECYIPAAVAGIATVVCIFGANALGKRQQESIASAYILLERCWKEYKDKAKEIVGKDTDAKIQESIINDKYEESDISPLFGKQLFYEKHYDGFFESTKEEVLNAEHELNRIFVSRGHVSLNEFYKLLNLRKNKIGDSLGWSMGDRSNCQHESPWIDFEHYIFTLDDGLECCTIEIPFKPTFDYLD